MTCLRSPKGSLAQLRYKHWPLQLYRGCPTHCAILPLTFSYKFHLSVSHTDVGTRILRI